MTIKLDRTAINAWLKQYNHIRPHQAMNMKSLIPESLLESGIDLGARQGALPHLDE